MKKYESIYSFNVMEEIVEGQTVMVLDREERTVQNAAEMKAGDLARVVKSKDKGRYEFWIEKEVEESENNDEQ